MERAVRGTNGKGVRGPRAPAYQPIRHKSYPRPLHLRYPFFVSAPKRDHDEWLGRGIGGSGVVPVRVDADTVISTVNDRPVGRRLQPSPNARSRRQWRNPGRPVPDYAKGRTL